MRRACPRCAAPTTSTSTEEECHVARTKYVVRVPAFVCKVCKESFIQGGVLERVELVIASELAAKGPRSGETLRYMRKALGLPAMQLATLLDVTAETMSRWERGQRPVDLNAWLTVGSLVLEKAGRSTPTLERIGAVKNEHARPKMVRIDLGASKRSKKPRAST